MAKGIVRTSRLGAELPRMALPPFWRATVSGVLATFAMTAWIYLTQTLGISQLEMARALAAMFGVKGLALFVGSAIHLIIGIVLSLIYAYGFCVLLPGPGWVRGLIYSLLPTTFLLAFVPMVGWGLIFAGVMAFGPLSAFMWVVNQLIYGFVLGAFYGLD